MRVLGVALAAACVGGCDTGQIAMPVVTGVQWTRITDATATPNPYFPDWRGDSLTFLYFVASGPSQGRSRMVTSRPDGTSLVYILGGVSGSDDLTPRWVDDSTIVFCSSRSAPQHMDIWYYTTTTQQLIHLADTPEQEWDAAPRPGQDGLVYTEGSIRTKGRITLIPQAHAAPTERFYLTPSSLVASEPDWDPTGQMVCFSADSVSGAGPSAVVTHHLFVVSLTDTIPKQITTGPFHDHYPHFSPDGTRILFTSDRTGRSGLWTIDPSGDQASIKLVVFEDAGKTLETTCWSPDGTKIIVTSDGHNYPRALWLLSNLP